MTQRLFCRKPFEWFELEASAEYPAFLCCSGWLPKPIGSVAAADPMDVWNSPAAQEIRSSILDGSFRHCERDKCPALQERSGPVSNVDAVEDPEMLDIIRNNRTILDRGPRILNCSYDASCNLQCPTCRTEKIVYSGASARPIEDLQDRLMTAFLPDLEWLYVTGSGDPIGSPTFLSLLRERDLSANPQLKLHLHTNAQLLTPRRWSSLQPNINRVRSIEVSIDAATAATYSLNRPPGRWDVLVKNMDFIGQLRRDDVLENLRISFVVQANNWREMAEFVECGRRWMADEVLFTRLVNWGTFDDKEFTRRAVHAPDHPERAAFIEQMRQEVFHQPQVRLGNLLSLLNDSTLPVFVTTTSQTPAMAVHSEHAVPAKEQAILCNRPWTGFRVDSDGEVGPCAWSTVSCGSVLTESPQSIWTGAGFHYVREQMRLGRHDAICAKHCPIRLRGTPCETGLVLGAPPLEELQSPGILNSFADLDSPIPINEAETWIREHWVAGASVIELNDTVVVDAEPANAWRHALSSNDRVRLKLNLHSIPGLDEIEPWLRHRHVAELHLPFDHSKGDHERGQDGGDLDFVLGHAAASRASSVPDLQIDLAFTIDAACSARIPAFLSLCAQHRAAPVFRLSEDPGSEQALLSALEVVEKALAKEGYPIATLAPVLAQVLSRRSAFNEVATRRIVHLSGDDPSGTALLRALSRLELADDRVIVRAAYALENCSHTLRHMAEVLARERTLVWSSPIEPLSDSSWERELEIEFSDCDLLPSVLARCERIREVAQLTAEFHLCFTVNRALVTFWSVILDALAGASVRAFSFRLPYWEDAAPVSALDYAEEIDRMILDGEARGWHFEGGRHDIHLLGVPENNQYPRLISERVIGAPKDAEISIVVPVHNRARTLERFCASIREQTCAVAMQIVFVDDGSTDDSRQVLDRLGASLTDRYAMTVIHLERAVPYQPFTPTFRAGSARQIGVEHGRGRYVVFLDPDQSVDPDAIESLLQFARLGFDVVIGSRQAALNSVPTWQHLLAARGKNSDLGQQATWWMSFFTGDVLVRRDLLTAAGGFDESLQLWGLEDVDLAFRFASMNAKVFHTMRSRVVHLDDYPSGGGETHDQVHRMQRLGMEVLYRKYLDPRILDGFAAVWRGSPEVSSSAVTGVLPDDVRYCCSVCSWKGRDWSAQGQCPTCNADEATRLLTLILARWQSRRWATLRTLDVTGVLRWPSTMHQCPFYLRNLSEDERECVGGTGRIAAGASTYHVIVLSSRVLEACLSMPEWSIWDELSRISVADGVVIVLAQQGVPYWKEAASAAGWDCFRVDSYSGSRRVGAMHQLPIWIVRRATDFSHVPI